MSGPQLDLEQWANHDCARCSWPLLTERKQASDSRRVKYCYGQRRDRRPFKRNADCERWVDTQWTRTGPREGHECAMVEHLINEQLTCGESIASIQSTTDWWRSRFEKCKSSPNDGPHWTTSLTRGGHDLRHWNELYVPWAPFKCQIISLAWFIQAWYCEHLIFVKFDSNFINATRIRVTSAYWVVVRRTN